jgi:hypothetical protein
MPDERSILWKLALSGQPIDATDWANALDQEQQQPQHDFRTRLLVRDGLSALRGYWARSRMEQWLSDGDRAWLREVERADLGEVGFPSLPRRLMDATKPETILQFFRALGDSAKHPARLNIGGSTSLILARLIGRHTEDIDVVDEVPIELRTDYELLQRLTDRFGLVLAHFQSHYLPNGWRDRMQSLGTFGKVDVFLVDPYDVLATKVVSAREKDQDDLRAVAAVIDKNLLAQRLLTAGKQFLGEPKLAANAEKNWYIVFAEPLPS